MAGVDVLLAVDLRGGNVRQLGPGGRIGIADPASCRGDLRPIRRFAMGDVVDLLARRLGQERLHQTGIALLERRRPAAVAIGVLRDGVAEEHDRDGPAGADLLPGLRDGHDGQRVALGEHAAVVEQLALLGLHLDGHARGVLDLAQLNPPVAVRGLGVDVGPFLLPGQPGLALSADTDRNGVVRLRQRVASGRQHLGGLAPLDVDGLVGDRAVSVVPPGPLAPTGGQCLNAFGGLDQVGRQLPGVLAGREQLRAGKGRRGGKEEGGEQLGYSVHGISLVNGSAAGRRLRWPFRRAPSRG